MPKSANKTVPRKVSVTEYIKSLPSAEQKDAKALLQLFKAVTL